MVVLTVKLGKEDVMEEGKDDVAAEGGSEAEELKTKISVSRWHSIRVYSTTMTI